jgi:hypothetical protein
MTSPGKTIYLISIINSANSAVSYCIVGSSLSTAITQAQTAAGVSHDPLSTQKMGGMSSGVIDFEV